MRRPAAGRILANHATPALDDESARARFPITPRAAPPPEG